MYEVYSIVTECAERSDEPEAFAQVRDLMADIISVVNANGGMVKLGKVEA